MKKRIKAILSKKKHTKIGKRNNKVNIYIIFGVIIGVLGVLIPFGVYFFTSFSASEREILLTWIGSFSVPFLSFSSIMILIGTIKIQKEDSDFRKFENTFFNLIDFNHRIVNAFKYEYDGNNYEGRACFELIYTEFKSRNIMKEDVGILQIVDGSSYRDVNRAIQNAYEEYFDQVEDKLGHYFRNLYHIFKFIDSRKEICDEDKMYYASLVRAQLSTYELLLIFYNVMSKYGRDKFKPLVLKYEILQNMNVDKLINKRHIDVFQRYN